jgi:DNA-binding CsgD family transcriptional regulator
MSSKTVLSFSVPATLAAFNDLELMQRWEVLRRAPSELSVREFATAVGIDLGAAQAELDRLIEAGLAVRLRASRTRKHIAYRSIATEVMLAWNPSVPEQRKAVQEFHLAMRSLSREIIDRHTAPEHRSSTPQACFFGYASVMLTTQEIDAVNRLLRAACAVIDEADIRAEERSRGTYSGDIGRDTEHPYHLAVEHRPLAHPEAPIPHFELWDERSVPREVARVTQSASTVLTPRELEIAKLLASGQTRPIIAKALGLTVNTVASVCKRIHTKLGIHTRAELTARLKGV